MTEQEWMASKDPTKMMKCYLAREKVGYWVSDRKLRLFACACCRIRGARSVTVDEYEIAGITEDEIGKIADISWAMHWTEKGTGKVTAIEKADLLREIIGNPFRTQDQHQFEWKQYRLAKSMAQTIYNDLDWGSLPILADALENAGYTNEEILNHLRSTGTHVRGCWVLDLLLGNK